MHALQITIFDDEHSKAEKRWITLSKTKNSTLLAVVYTVTKHDDSATVRIISAMEATKREQHRYEES